MLMRLLTFLMLFVLISCAAVGKKPSPEEDLRKTKNAFVSVKNGHFFRHEKPYYFVGANMWYGAYLGSTESGRQRLIQELDALKKNGITNLRILAVTEQTDLKMAVRPASHLAPGKYDEALFVGLDVVLVEMAKRDMQAVLYLNNYWQWSGGMAQYMSWLTGELPLDPDITGDWNGFMQNSAKFYPNEKAQEWYQNVVRTLVNRINSVSGMAYKNDPTIMAWQLANEPRPGSDKDGRPNFESYKSWLIKSAEFIKGLDANHLVSTGSEGAMGTLRDITLYQDAHGNPAIDYLTFHMWPKNWSWFDIKKPDETYAETLAKSKAYLLEHIQVAKALGKPIVLEEFGIERDKGNYARDSTTTQRDQYFQEIYTFIENQARLSSVFAGSNFWAWGGYGRAQADDFIWRANDPFTGDPPQEAQGLNSVFAEDAATLTIIREHAKKLSTLSESVIADH
jgi:mannan endo-1,4-beta-mannosidase